MIESLVAWWQLRGVRRCAAGRHAWMYLTPDRVACKRPNCHARYPG